MSETRILRAPRRMPVRITLRNYSFEHKTVLAAFTENFTQEQKVLRDIKKRLVCPIVAKALFTPSIYNVSSEYVKM